MNKCMGTQENEEKALVLHTLPGAIKSKKTEVAADDKESQEVPQGTDADNKEKKGKLSVSTITIPRLISVVEIIKREYLAAMNAKRSPDLVGLYQYNEMGSLENETGEDGEEDRAKMITEALSGTKK